MRDIAIIALAIIAILAMTSCSKGSGPMPEPPTPTPVPTPTPKIMTYHIGNNPWAMCQDSDGNIWIADGGMSNLVTKFVKTSGTFTTFAVDNLPEAITSYKGKVYTANWKTIDGRGSISSVDEKNGEIKTYSYPQSWGSGIYPGSIVATGDTICVINANSVVKMSVITKVMTIKKMTIGRINVFGLGVAIDSKKNLWVPNGDTCSIMKVSPSGETTRYMVPNQQGQNVPSPGGMVFDGSYLWSYDFSNGGVIKISPETGEMVEYKIAPPKGQTATQVPLAITFEKNEKKYIFTSNADFGSAYGSVSRINVVDGTSTTWTLGVSQDNYSIVASNDTLVWIADNKSGNITKVMLPKP